MASVNNPLHHHTHTHTHQPLGVWGLIRIGPHRGMPVLQAGLRAQIWQHMTSSLALWWYSLPKHGCESIPLTGLHSYKEKQSVFVHELNSWAPFRGRKLHYTCTFSTHYRVTTDLTKMTGKRLKWTPRRPFSSACPGRTHCNNYVKMCLRQLGRNIKHSVFIWQLGSLEVVKFNRMNLESRKCGGAEGPSAPARRR